MSSIPNNKLIKALGSSALAILLLVSSLFVESTLASQKVTEPDYILKTETPLSNFEIQLSDDQQFTSLKSKYFFNFPKKVQTKDADLTHINLFKDTNLYLGKDTTLETLIAKSSEHRIHQKLDAGELIIDNRQTNKSLPSIQTSNVFFQPFTNGIYYISNKNNEVTLGAIQGSFLIGIFNNEGVLEGKLIIHRNQQISFPTTGLSTSDLDITSLASIPHIDKFKFSEFFSIDDSILEGELFQLIFKGRELTPDRSPSWQASFQSLNFNQNKKDFLTVYPFYQKLEQAKKDIKTNQSKNLNSLLVEAKLLYTDALVSNPEASEKFNQTANQNLQLISGLSPLSDLNALKIFLTSTFSQHLDSPTSLKIVLSLLEDINYGFDNNKPDISIKSEQVLSGVISSQGFKNLEIEDKINVLVVMDNILTTYNDSFTLDLFKARQNVVVTILDSTDDTSLSQSFQDTQVQYLQTVIQRGREGTLNSSTAKKIAFYLVDTLPENLQEDLRSQINTIDN